jgi:hypothetical protein
MNLKIHMVVDKCIYNRIAIFIFLFLNCIEVQRRSKFARSSANFCHTMSRPLSAFGKWGPLGTLRRVLQGELESRHNPVTLRSLNQR